MFRQITPCLGLQHGYKVADFDKELIFGALLGRERSAVALGGKLLDAALGRFISAQRKNLLGGCWRQTPANGSDDASQQCRGCSFRSHGSTISQPTSSSERFFLPVLLSTPKPDPIRSPPGLNRSKQREQRKPLRYLLSLLNQFLHRLMPVHKVMRPAGEISHSGFVNVNSHVVVKRREDLLEKIGRAHV